MSRKGENIYKRKDGRWEGRYIKERNTCGKAVYGYVYAPTYTEVKRKLIYAAAATIEKESHAQEEPNCGEDNASVLFNSVANDWLCYLEPQIKESTYAKYSNELILYIFPAFEGMKIEDITISQLESLSATLLKTGGTKQCGLSSKTVGDTFAVIRRILYYADQKGFKTSCTGKEVRIKQATKDLRVLNITEQRILCEYLLADLTLFNIGILLCLYTGLRLGEVCGLRWEDVSFSENTLSVRQSVQRIHIRNSTDQKTKLVVSTPKSKCSIRTIPLPQNIAQILKSQYHKQKGFILSCDEKNPAEPRAVQYHFKKVIKACNLPDVNFHALRHTFATRCVEVGFDVKSLSEILGHASVNITMNRYVHPSLDMKRDNMKKLSDFFTVNPGEVV